MNSAHQLLRAGTREEHERLDGLFAGFDLSTRGGYRRFLAAHAEALIPTEAALDAIGAGAVIADWPERKRGQALAEDLKDMGGEPAVDAARPDLSSQAAAVGGAIYVLEGSRLGGRFLARQLHDDFPRRYLNPDYATSHWRDLLERLDAMLNSAEQQAIAIDAAATVFARFEAAGRKWLVKE